VIVYHIKLHDCHRVSREIVVQDTGCEVTANDGRAGEWKVFYSELNSRVEVAHAFSQALLKQPREASPVTTFSQSF
jgi:hypothetical protein